MCKFKEKSLMLQYVKNKPIKWGFRFWFQCGSKSGYLYQFDMYLGKKPKIGFGLRESVVLSLCENLKKQLLLRVLWQLFYKSKSHAKAIWGWNLLNWNRQSNRKHMPTLEANKQMKRGEHDWLACDTILATKWMENRSVILLSSYHNPSVVQEINRRIKGSKEKVKESYPTVIREYNTEE